MENMKKYVLCETIEREISTPEFFDTHDAVFRAMLERFSQVMDIPYLELVIHQDEYEDEITEYSAYCERHGNNYDWKIFEVEIN